MTKHKVTKHKVFNPNFYLGLASSILISIGAITAVSTLSNPIIGIIITAAGAVGLGIREFLKE